MYKMMNITDTSDDMGRFEGDEDLKQYCQSLGLCGVEYQKVMNQGGIEDSALICGVHLSCPYSWVNLWNGNEEALLLEYGSRKTIEEYYGGTDRAALIAKTRKELAYAKSVGAKYVVFHICEVRLDEVWHRRFHHSDEEVADAAASLVNALLDGQDYEFDFLMENLWWSGLNLMDAKVTGRLLSQVHYDKKGIMLDTGHLMNTNTALRSQAEAGAYIQKILDDHEQYLPYIKGIHLNASLSGEYVQKQLASDYVLAEDYWQRWADTCRIILNTDLHQPFTDSSAADIIRRVQPKYLTYELISSSRQIHEKLIRQQTKALEGRI